MTSKFIEDLVARHDGLLVHILQDIQNNDGYISEDAVKDISEELNIKTSAVYGVASFYGAFSFTPKGKHIITVCTGTACHVRGASKAVDIISEELSIQPGETTQDMQFTLETVACLGCCAMGPVVVVNGKYHGKMTPGKIEKLLLNLQEGETNEKNKISI